MAPRASCNKNTPILPAKLVAWSHLAIDESMMPYRGNSSHTVKMKNKPISEGYKVWVRGDQGYVWYFLWYSCVTGTESIPKKGQLVNLPVPFRPVHLASTFATVIQLAAQLRSSGAAVLGMTTAYSLDQTIWRERKRPALTSTNAHIVRPVFGDAVKKWLEIPLAIDEYNHCS